MALRRTPAHRAPDGRFVNPWPTAEGAEHGAGDMLRWMWERQRNGVAPNPPAEALPVVESDIAAPRGAPGELRVTWVGHSTLLVQIGPYNVLTDPVWGRRASPVSWAGPARLAPPGIELDALPPIDAVVLSHDHYDHLDDPTVRRLHERYPDSLVWLTPLGYSHWLRRRGIRQVGELDWWQAATLDTQGAPLSLRLTPAQHWTRRGPGRQRRLWGSWALRGPGGASFYFGGDTGYFPGFREIGERAGPFDALALPIGAYEPRWFMRPMHMNPEEAVQAYGELGGRGTFVATHWGTFRLTDEPVLEPPVRVRRAWRAAGRADAALAVLRHGESIRIPTEAA